MKSQKVTSILFFLIRLLRIDDILNQLSSNIWFNALDLKSG